MPWIKLPGGGVAHIHVTRRRARCKACKQRYAEFECDWKIKARKSGTCDMKLCDRCAFSPAPEKHLCPVHRLAYDQWLKRRDQQKKPQEGT